ncbi:hypothetical protein LBMAG10_09390 [Actinomycetes bacterium]|nr:hypothetical protein LBMAG10_09390 [Actinomycetes bacterium]
MSKQLQIALTSTRVESVAHALGQRLEIDLKSIVPNFCADYSSLIRLRKTTSVISFALDY